jgi:uncharacterized protein
VAAGGFPGKIVTCPEPAITGDRLGGMDSGITVTATGQASAPADLLRLSLSVGHDAQDVAAAVAAVAERTDAVTAALREQGLAAADIQTSSVNVFPQYGDAMRVAGYRASHSLSVSTPDLSGFGRLLTAAVNAAGNDLSVEQVSFGVADNTALLDEARRSAFADAREKAVQLAELAGRPLGSIEAVEETYGGYHPIGRESSALAAPDLAVAPGEQTVQASLTVQWSWA